jgi:dynactin 1
LEELAHESSALKAYLVPQLDALCNIVSEMVNFGIQVSIEAVVPFDLHLRSFSARPTNDAPYR